MTEVGDSIFLLLCILLCSPCMLFTRTKANCVGSQLNYEECGREGIMFSK